MSADRATPDSWPVWQVAAFWGLALLGPLTASLAVRTFTDSLSPVVSTTVLALAMPAPLVAALVVARQRPTSIVPHVRTALADPVGSIVVPLLVVAVWFAVVLVVTAAVGNGLGVDGVGRVATGTDEVRMTIAEQFDPDIADEAELPPVPALLAIGLLGAVVAGVTVNGLVAFGEEYGWRGFLWERTVGHGRWATIGLVGVLWGLWHAPAILIVGHNYPDERLAGVAMMVVFTVAFSWPLDEIRRATTSVVGAAVLHGALNGTAGTLVVVIGGDRLWAAPTGIIGALAAVPAGVVARWLTRGRRRSPSPPAPIA